VDGKTVEIDKLAGRVDLSLQDGFCLSHHGSSQDLRPVLGTEQVSNSQKNRRPRACTCISQESTENGSKPNYLILKKCLAVTLSEKTKTNKNIQGLARCVGSFDYGFTQLISGMLFGKTKKLIHEGLERNIHVFFGHTKYGRFKSSTRYCPVLMLLTIIILDIR
jgi:hypothetical protein